MDDTWTTPNGSNPNKIPMIPPVQPQQSPHPDAHWRLDPGLSPQLSRNFTTLPLATDSSPYSQQPSAVTSGSLSMMHENSESLSPIERTSSVGCPTTSVKDMMKIESKSIHTTVFANSYGDGYGPPPTASDVYTGTSEDSTATASLGYFGMGAYPAVAIAPPATLADPLNEQMKRDKEAIHNHPLFPLLSCLFKKCELATCTTREQNSNTAASTSTSTSAIDVCSPTSFKDDLADFVKMVENKKPYYIQNSEVDTLMLQSIQVLRFHLLELEKVHELCDNFCHRYVTCFKGKMPMDIDGAERASSSRTPLSPSTVAPSSSPSMSTPLGSQHQPAPYQPQSVPLPENTTAVSAGHDGYHGSVHNLNASSPSSAAVAAAAAQQHPSTTPDNHHLVLRGVPPLTAGSTQTSILLTVVSSPSGSSSAGDQRFDSTPHSVETPSQLLAVQQQENVSDRGDESLSMCGSLNDDGGRESVSSDGNTESGSGSGTGANKRKLFTKETITKFRAWLFQNLTQPYPSEDQKKQFAHETGLTIMQVNNWFINARRRIVQPMIDHNNRVGRPNGVSVFKNRRRRSSGQSSGQSSDLPSVGHTYTPGSNQLSAVAAAGYPAQAMFPSNPYAANAHPAFTNPAALTDHMFMPGPMSHMMVSYSAAQTQMGANVCMESLMPGHMSMNA